ncbi:MAG: 50S ribosomal protein L30 [Propionibacteriaceae bacterium]|nr:50S ribosomal protein L30 [Propionibacteriaceae bacterium]
MSQVVVKQTKSQISEKPTARATLRALGLHRIGDQVVHEDVPSIRGMIKTVAHLVTVEEVK